MSRESVHRNDPCPCGSGRKYKNCHGRQGGSMGRPVAVPLWAMILGVVVVGGAAAMGAVLVTRQRNTVPERVMPAPLGATLPSPGATNAAGPEPAPWTYDPRTNKHWHPEHRHWHDGPAPVGAARDSSAAPVSFSINPTPAPVATPEPAPWSRDETDKRYWDPRHHHWHNGPTPTLAQRESLLAVTARRDTARHTPAAAAGAAAADSAGRDTTTR